MIPGTQHVQKMSGVSVGWWCNLHKSYLNPIWMRDAKGFQYVACEKCLGEEHFTADPAVRKPLTLQDTSMICTVHDCWDTSAAECAECGEIYCASHLKGEVCFYCLEQLTT